MNKESMKYLKVRFIGKILLFVFLPILSLLSLIFVFMNARMLFAGDFMAYSAPVAGLFSLIFTIIVNLYIIAYSVILLIYTTKKEINYIDTPISILTIAYVIIVLINVFNYALNKSHGYMAYIDLVTLFGYVGSLVGGFMFFVFTYHYKKSLEPAEEVEEQSEEENSEEAIQETLD